MLQSAAGERARWCIRDPGLIPASRQAGGVSPALVTVDKAEQVFYTPNLELPMERRGLSLVNAVPASAQPKRNGFFSLKPACPPLMFRIVTLPLSARAYPRLIRSAHANKK